MTTTSIWSASHWAFRTLLVLVALLASDLNGNAALGDGAVCLRPGDEVWEVSSRCLPTLQPCVTLSAVTFGVSQYTGNGWQASDQGQLQASFAAAPSMRTVIYAHGNWMTAENARGRGTYVYRRASQRAAEPLRFIIYTWPSQREGRPVRDVYEKVERSDTDTYYFAHLLSRIPAETPLGVQGFSFGARVVCGALHMVNGGQSEGRCSPVWDSPRQIDVSLIAPAFDRTWLTPGQAYGNAMNSVESLVNVYNSRDPVLRRFRFIDRVSTPMAAGFTGLADPRSTQPLESGQHIRQYDCGADVGNSHDEMNYYERCCAYVAALDNVLGR